MDIGSYKGGELQVKEIIAVINQKGGVGKSTTAYALGAGLRARGNRVLFIDLDAQGNLSYTMDCVGREPTAFDVLEGGTPAAEAAVGTKSGDIIPSGPALSGADTVITGSRKEYRLADALEPLKKEYSYIVIDTPPALGILTVNALTACSSVVIPAQADIYSLQGIGQLSSTVQAVKKYCNAALTIKGILLTRYSPRAILTRDMTELLENTAAGLNTKVFATRIRECIAIKEAQAVKQDIFSYSPKSNAAFDYNAFIEEIIK